MLYTHEHTASFYLCKRWRLVVVFLVSMHLYCRVHHANIVHAVFAATPPAIIIRRFVPATFLAVPFKFQLFKPLLMGLRVAEYPHKAPYDFDLNPVQFQQLSNQPLKFFRCLLRFLLIHFPILINVYIFHSLEKRFILSIENFHLFIRSSHIRMQFQAQPMIVFLQFFQCFNIFVEIFHINCPF